MEATARVFCAETVIAVHITPPGLVPVTSPTALVCSGGGQALPFHSQAVITLRTGEATRRGYGRIFVPYLTENQAANGVPEPASLTILNNGADKLAIPVGTTPLNLVLYHKDTRTATNVGSAAARPYWAFLSSRRD